MPILVGHERCGDDDGGRVELLAVCERLALPLSTTRPLYQTAFHLQFWRGAQDEGCLTRLLDRAMRGVIRPDSS